MAVDTRTAQANYEAFQGLLATFVVVGAILSSIWLVVL